LTFSVQVGGVCDPSTGTTALIEGANLNEERMVTRVTQVEGESNILAGRLAFVDPEMAVTKMKIARVLKNEFMFNLSTQKKPHSTLYTNRTLGGQLGQIHSDDEDNDLVHQ
jgi:hypothetical protein